MSGFPKGLQVLLVDGGAHPHDSPEAPLRSLSYSVTAVSSLEAAQACFASGAAAFDCVLLEHSLLAGVPSAAATAFFKQAAAAHAPVVLMAASPSQAAVLEGVHLGAADFLERPLSLHKLRNLWQHKIRTMMQTANGGVLPRTPSCPQLTTAATAGLAAAAGATSSEGGATKPGARATPGFSCPNTPSIGGLACLAPQPSNSLGSTDSGAHPMSVQLAAAATSGTADRSDATSGVPAAQPEAAAPAGAAAAALAAPEPISLPAAPLACLRLGAVGDALPSTVHWPPLPGGTTWGTPLGCGVPPPLLPGSPGAAADKPAAPPADLAIRWCPPGTLPVPASTSELLLPEDFSLARCAAEAREAGALRQQGPLGLRLTVSPDLLADINCCLSGGRLPAGGSCSAVAAAAFGLTS